MSAPRAGHDPQHRADPTAAGRAGRAAGWATIGALAAAAGIVPFLVLQDIRQTAVSRPAPIVVVSPSPAAPSLRILRPGDPVVVLGRLRFFRGWDGPTDPTTGLPAHVRVSETLTGPADSIATAQLTVPQPTSN